MKKTATRGAPLLISHLNPITRVIDLVISSSNYSIAVTWLLALHLAIPPLLGWSYYSPELSGMRYIFLRTSLHHCVNLIDVNIYYNIELLEIYLFLFSVVVQPGMIQMGQPMLFTFS